MNKVRGLERHARWILALAVTALPAIASDTGPVLTVAEGPAGTTLALDQAAPFHTTDRTVVDPQLVQIPNSAGVVVDAIRCAKLALDRGIGGTVIGPSAYFMKSPPEQYTDDAARDLVEAFIAGDS